MKESKKLNPLISIIVPVYNAEKYLEQCLESLCNQTYHNMEIICVDDASLDQSASILRRYEQKDRRIHIIEQKEQMGVSLARNKALEMVSGEYLMFVDSDDWLDLETCMDVLSSAKENNLDVVMWGYTREFLNSSQPKKIFDQNMFFSTQAECREKLHRRMVGIVGEELKSPESADALCTVWGKLYRTSIIKENKITFEDIRKIGTYEDGIFNLYVFLHIKKVMYLNRHYYHYRKQDEKSLTSYYKPKLVQQWIYLYRLMEKYIERENLTSIYNEALANRISLGIFGLGLNVLESNENILKQIKTIKTIINRKQYRKSVKKLKLKYFPIHWKVFYGCAKYNLASMVWIMLVVIRYMMKSR